MYTPLLTFIFSLCLASAAFAQTDIEKGKALYDRLCAFCHGREGAGDGPAAQYLNPAPRDFTMGLYKWKTTPFDEYAPADEDLFRMISGMRSHDSVEGWDGMNGTSMPGWSDVLGKEEMNQLAAYIKTLAGYEKAGNGSIDLSGKVAPDDQSIERGRVLFKDRCSECHGELGRGDATKKLKDDWGGRTWPRDLTQGWTFRAGASAEDIYTRVTVGIPGTQMPSFADPASNKVMTEAQRWDVANYAASLSEPGRKPSVNNTIKAVRSEKPVEGPNDPLWDKIEPAALYLFPQIFTAEKDYTPSIGSVVVRAVYNENEIAFLLEWDDPTNSMPWDAKALEIADGQVFPDSIAIQFPAGQSRPGEKPYFGMGGPRPVVIWQWKGQEAADALQSVRVLDARGARDIVARQDAGGITAAGVYDRGRWRVLMKAPIKGPEKDPVFEEGVFAPVAFALWDGSNNEYGSRHVMTGWQWMRLEKEGEGPDYFWPAAIGIVVFCAEMLLLFSRRRD